MWAIETIIGHNLILIGIIIILSGLIYLIYKDISKNEKFFKK